MQLRLGIIVAAITLFIFCENGTASHVLQHKTNRGDYWRKQVLADIIPYWTTYARDTIYGGFYTNIGVQWELGDDARKYPSMISRHIFSYAVAYLLSGDEKYLDIARETKDFLIDHAWDKEYGGWFDLLDREGDPLEKTKSLFIQAYAITGLTMYYIVTHDKKVLHYIEQSNFLLETKAWDNTKGGYFNRMTRDWKVLDSRKTLASQLAPVSGYLLYLYLATRDQKYLDQSVKIMDNTIFHTICKKYGWALETFDKDWSYLGGSSEKVNIGHNLEVAWILMRLWLLNNNPSYLRTVNDLEQNLRKYGYAEENGFWFTGIEKANPENHDDFTYWWVQAYGNMFDLCAFRTSARKMFLCDFEKGARFWDSFFIDREHGDTFFSVFQSGRVKDSIKANPFKASYHSMEHCLLNYMYLNLWVNYQPVVLHFTVKTDAKADTLYPVFIEDSRVKIKKVFYIENNKQYPLKTFDQRSISLPLSKELRLIVELEYKQ